MLTKKIQQEEQSVQEELTPFPSSPAAFVSHFATPVTAPSSAGAHKAGARNGAGRDQSILALSWLFGPRAMRFITSKVACMMFLENHGTSSFQSRLTLLL